MTHRPPLHLHFLAHPKSDLGKQVASGLMARFVEPPVSGGLRVPIFFTPDLEDDLPPKLESGVGGIDLDAAEHTIVVVLADERMARKVKNGTGDQWRAFIEEALGNVPIDSRSHHILPVALESDAFNLGGKKHFLHALRKGGLEDEEARERQLTDISLQVGARALRLLTDKPAVDQDSGKATAPVCLFISHAKADLSEDKSDPAHQTMTALSTLPIGHWYDAADIETGEEFKTAIKQGIEDAAIVVAFHTDAYDSRPWCRREVLCAKEAAVQLLLVDALKDRVARHFPYLGNVPSVRWRFDSPEASANRVVDRAVLEALRLRHNVAVLEGTKAPQETVLAAPPEALTLAQLGLEEGDAATLLYPDPPLGSEELAVLKQLRHNATFLTPLTKMALEARLAGSRRIAVSISESSDIARFGLSTAHEQTLTDELHLYLLLAGHAIAYGGALQGTMAHAGNFTLRLFELVRCYGPLAERIAKEGFHPIVNVPPWPLYCGYGDKEYKLFGNEAELEEGPEPDLPWTLDEAFPETAEGWRFLATTPQQRYAWARGLSAMREKITDGTDAKLVVGGNLHKFQGVVPGVLEEAWWSLKKQQPLYLVGAFGGCARAVSDMLTDVKRPEFDATDAIEVPDFQKCVDLYQEHGGAFTSLEDMGRDFASLRTGGLAAALNNGLTDAENEELILSSSPGRIAELVLAGLSELP